jgi:hypothetical protein
VQIGPFLREICPRNKCTPHIGADIGAITGILLKLLNGRLKKGKLHAYMRVLLLRDSKISAYVYYSYHIRT